ncbi:MAG TPA: aldo/keto reductase [Gemmatimonadaceae bacterium]|nr:aldo/keto reductase [Gemmatimonadaceae bacterium]
MQTRRFGRTELAITPLGFGSWAIGGGDWEFGWGPQDEHDAIEAVQRAVELGMNWIDTAAVYGLGRSEELVGRAIAGMATRPLVFTKCSMRWNAERKIYRSLEPASVREECEASLRRLGVDAIDLYQIHWPNPEADIERGWEAMVRLREEGLVRHIGVSNFSPDQMSRLMPIAPVETLQPPYSLANRRVEAELLAYCAQHDIGVIVYAPMASGLLTGAMTRERVAGFPENDWRRNNRQYQEPLLSRNLELVELLRTIGARHGSAPGEVAIAWTLRRPEVSGAIVGGRSGRQVAGMIGAAELRLSDDELAEIERFASEVAAT